MSYRGPWGRCKEILTREEIELVDRTMYSFDQRYLGFWDLGNGSVVVEYSDGVQRTIRFSGIINMGNAMRNRRQ